MQALTGTQAGGVVRANFLDLMTPDEQAVLRTVFERVARTITPDRPPLSGLS